MITIIRKSRDFTKVEEYLMTTSPTIISMKDVEDGTSIKVDGTLYFTDNKGDEESEILSVITPDKTVYSCQSATFKRSLEDIMCVMDGDPFSVIKTSGISKGGRPYINCQLDLDSVSC